MKIKAVFFYLIALGLTAALLPVNYTKALSPNMNKIEPEALAAIKTHGIARVVVALQEPPSLKSSTAEELGHLQKNVALLQNDALSTVNPSEFEVTLRYQSLPGLVGIAHTEAALVALANRPSVIKIGLDEGGGGALAQSVSLIGANLQHTAGFTGTGVTVAIMDSGLDFSHPDLAGKTIDQACFADTDGVIDGIGKCPNGSDRQYGPGSAIDDAGHGTHVAGIIASNGIASSVGVAPGVNLVIVKISYGPSFAGTFYSFTELTAGLDYLVNNRPDVQVINMSLVTNAVFTGDCDSTYAWLIPAASAINIMRARGAIAFASSGNTGQAGEMTAPACLSNVVSVGSTSKSDALSYYTSRNSNTDLLAPGEGILSDAIGGGTVYASGTSMSSPHAAGCAALLIQSGVAVSPDQIESRLKQSNVNIFDSGTGLSFPRINCAPYKRYFVPITIKAQPASW
ncbi:MAG: S8 family serine peptidase [Anaerolineae bacterium]